MNSTVAKTLVLAGAAMVLVPLVFSYSYHGRPPESLFGDVGISYSWACCAAGIVAMAIGVGSSFSGRQSCASAAESGAAADGGA